MVRMPWIPYLWPGLPQLWYGGLWSGLALAVGSAVLLNVLLLATFVWVELLSPSYLRYAWLGTGALWIGAAATSAWFGWGGLSGRTTSAEGMFREALHEYLKGNWFETERLLGQLLHSYPRDVEARLMLATLLRHTGRYPEALDHLGRLELLQSASLWAMEIAAEKAWIAEAKQQEPDSIPTIDTPFSAVSPRAA
jgi:tetratricopeptide (TPR) repeat protein